MVFILSALRNPSLTSPVLGASVLAKWPDTALALEPSFATTPPNPPIILGTNTGADCSENASSNPISFCQTIDKVQSRSALAQAAVVQVMCSVEAALKVSHDALEGIGILVSNHSPPSTDCKAVR